MLNRSKSNAGRSVLSNEQKYLPEMCRICLDDGEIPIFGVNDISDDVTEYGNIRIGKGDNRPQYLCEACHTLLEAAILFRKTAKQSDEVLGKMAVPNEIEESDSKQEDETYIKKEYLELTYSSDSEPELDDFDRLKRECGSEDETTNYNKTISEVDTQDSDDNQTDLLHVKRDEDGSINEADSETIMIIVSDKDKQNGDENSDQDFDNAEETSEHNDPSVNQILSHQCEVCHKVVLKSAYKAHLKEHREKYKNKLAKKNCKVECEFCGKHISKTYIKIHKTLHGTAEEQAERLIECTICNKMFNVYYYNEHVKRIHQKEKKRCNVKRIEPPSPKPKYKKCPVCDKKVKETDFKLHVEKHNGPLRRYICDKCGRVFKHQSAFKTHCLTHGSELKYKCQFCPYRGLHQGLLKIHVRTHTGDYNYKCTECPGRFITKSNLSKHLMRHKGICSFKCEICGKGFYSNRDLEKHNKNFHMLLKNLICEFCGKGFGHRDNILNHQLKVHKREKIITKGRMPSYLKEQFRQLQ